jgi:FMN reductase
MTAAKMMAITAGLSQPSSSRLLTDRLIAASERALALRGVRAVTEVVELREWARDLSNNLVTGFPSAGLAALVARLTAADAVIAVTPIFSASYSGLFKMFFDVLDVDALSEKPTLIGATGGSVRHSLALEHAVRPLFSYLGATVAPTAVYAAAEDWASEGALAARMERAGEELAGLLDAGTPPAAQPLADLVPFERLLAAQQQRSSKHG